MSSARKKAIDSMILAGQAIQPKDSPSVTFMKSQMNQIGATLDAERFTPSSVTVSEHPASDKEFMFGGKSHLANSASKGKRFFCVGTPIMVSNEHLCFRNNIADAELRASFPTTEKIMLFWDEYHALQYARAMRAGDFRKEACFQPPIIVVELLKDLPNVNIRIATLFINDQHRLQNGTLVEGEVMTMRTYFTEVARTNVAPISAMLVVNTQCGERKYPSIQFSDDKNVRAGACQKFFSCQNRQHKVMQLMQLAFILATAWMIYEKYFNKPNLESNNQFRPS